MRLRLRPLLSCLLLVALSGCVPATGQSASPPEPPPAWDPSALEHLVLEAVNRVREAAGLRPLDADPDLAAIARAHSHDMARRGFFAHRTPEGRTPGNRARLAGYLYHAFAENLFRGPRYRTLRTWHEQGQRRHAYEWYTDEDLAAEVVAAWLQSTGHRENLYAAEFRRGGVGVAVTPDHRVWITLNLSAP